MLLDDPCFWSLLVVLFFENHILKGAEQIVWTKAQKFPEKETDSVLIGLTFCNCSVESFFAFGNFVYLLQCLAIPNVQ